MTRFDVQKGAVVGGPENPAPVAPATAKKSNAFHIGRYEAQQKRRKQTLAQKLLQLQYPGEVLTFTGDNCVCEKQTSGKKATTQINNYVSRVCDFVGSDKWEKLARTDRYDALHLLIPKEFHTTVPGGMVYQVRFSSSAPYEEWVFLTVGHEVGRCKLVPTALAARVF